MTVRTDNFARGNGGLGASWTDWSWGATGAQILGGVATGTGNPDSNGDFWNADAIGDDQFSLITVAAVPSASEWVGVTVRQSGTGGNGYLAIWFNGSFMLFNENGSPNPPLITSAAGTLAVGDSMCIGAAGTAITVYHNGTQVLSATDATTASGAPGIAFDGASGTVSLWMGGDGATAPLAGFSSADANSVQTWYTVSAGNLPGPAALRVRPPASPAPGFPHAFLLMLPVEPGQGSTFGDPIATAMALGAQDAYNLTLVQPGFAIAPWYADNPGDAGVQQETFLADEVVPWVKANLAVTGSEKIYLIGFSKSGLGGQGLLFRHPSLFAAGAFWDAPMMITDYDGTDPTNGAIVGGGSAAVYGTSANFTANYQVSSGPNLAAFRDASNFATVNRIWLGGFNTFGPDMDAYDALLTSNGIQHTYASVSASAHNWAPAPGWVGPALAAMIPAAPGTGLLITAGIV